MREKEWGQVVEARDGWRRVTAVKLLKPLEKAAYADGAMAEGGLALLLRVRLENGVVLRGDSEELDFPLGAGADRKKKDDDGTRDPFADPLVQVPAEPGAEGFNGRWPGAVRQLEGELAAVPAEVREAPGINPGDGRSRCNG